MSSKYKGLVVVESPNKAKKIQKYLGSNYNVVATKGHCIDLPKSSLGIDMQNNFEPQYVTSSGKDKILKTIQNEATRAQTVFLATDPDREGEAIAYLVAEKLPKGTNYKRAIFNEITQSAVQKAISNPQNIDKNLYNAQKARRVLDRIVGYKISPLLWTHIAKKLSAGRVQSIGLKILSERQKERDAFKSQEYWEIYEDLQTIRSEDFRAQLDVKDKFDISSEKEAEKIVQDLKKQKHQIKDVDKKQKSQGAYPVFITSTLQRTASTCLNFSSKQTMSLAQELFEDGLITYHRTDSTRISSQALTDARTYISNNYAANYLPPQPNLFKQKKGSQDAHEGIRPTDVSILASNITKNKNLKDLYDLIWCRFIACQMTPAIFDQTKVTVEAGKYLLVANGNIMQFDGWLKVWGKYGNFSDTKLPAINKGEGVSVTDIEKEQKFTQPPPNYTESSLIKELESNGVGRPSTYSSIISTILDREYAEKQGKSLIPTKRGMEVSDFLISRFPELMDIDFTAEMEEGLDKVAEGKKQWNDDLGNFWKILSKEIDDTKEFIKKSRVTNIICPKCGGNLLERVSKYKGSAGLNKFFGCENWKKSGGCDYTIDAKKDDSGNIVPITEEEAKKAQKERSSVVYLEKNGQKQICPKCGKGNIVQRSKKKGNDTFWACDAYPKCKTIVDEDLKILK